MKTKSDFFDEDEEWLQLEPVERLLETTKLWAIYRLMGGNLDPEPDPQSPFYVFQTPRSLSVNRRASVHYLRSQRIQP